MARRRAIQLALTGAATVALAAPATAQGTVTIGSNLGRAPDAGQGCTPQCTLLPSSLSAAAAAPGGLVSPVNGTVVTWRIRTGGSTTASAFRVARLLADGTATASATSPTVTPPLNATQTYPVQLPIKIGDTIGIDCCNPGSADILVATTATGLRNAYLPRLADGGSPQMQNSPPVAWELAINADIEPTSTFSVMGVQRSKHGKLLISANLPNPGILVAGDEKDATVAVAAAKKRKKKPQLLKRASVQLSAPGSTQLLVFPTKMAKTALAQGKKVKAGLKLSFTPTAGTASTQVIKVKLRR